MKKTDTNELSDKEFARRWAILKERAKESRYPTKYLIQWDLYDGRRRKSRI